LGAAFTFSRLLQGGEDTQNMIQEQLAGTSQARAARGTHKEPRTQVFFQFLDCPRQRRLFDM
jgi:hypothetical protein